jgi:hypothetical protein
MTARTKVGKPTKATKRTQPEAAKAEAVTTNGTTPAQPEADGSTTHTNGGFPIVAEPPRTSPKPPVEKDELGRFLPGNNGGPGRPPGSKNKLVEDFISDFHDAWQESGADALKKMVKDDPAAFVRAAVQLMPKDVLVEARGAGLVVIETPAAIKALLEAMPELINGKAVEALVGPAEEADHAIRPAC